MNHIISITCHDSSDFSKEIGAVDVELTADGKLSVGFLKDEFNLKSVKKIVTVNGIEKCVGIQFDKHGVSLNSFANIQSLKITGEIKGMIVQP